MPPSLSSNHSPSFRRRKSSSQMFRSIFSASSVQSFSNHPSISPSQTTLLFRRWIAFLLFVIAVIFLCDSAGLFRFPSHALPTKPYYNALVDFALSNNHVVFSQDNEEYRLEQVLKNATTKDKTVILTTMNEAWAGPNSVLDLFLESFTIGHRTRQFLNHLVIVAFDEKAFRRCLSLHPHCVVLVTEGVDFSKEASFMKPDYLQMMWRRIDFLRTVLEMGYNFVFTDADVMWFRDPFPHFDPDADFQIACDHFSGDPFDVNNRPNGGFNYVKSNNRSIEFYKFWHSAKEKYPGFHDQDVLNFIKHNPYISEIGLKMKFLDTAYFGGFCEPSKDLNEVCTMHANCCIGMNNKLFDLKILLQDWRLFMSLPPSLRRTQQFSWRVPKQCGLRAHHPVTAPKNTVNPPKNSKELEHAM